MESNESVEQRLHPTVWPLVKHCITSERLISHGGLVHVKNFKNSAPGSTHETNCDRFTFSLPYCTMYIDWEILFDYRHISLPPDIVLGPSSHGFAPQIETIKTFQEWDVMEVNSLSNIIEELLVLFRDHQQVVISSHHRLQFELNSLVENTSYSEVDVWRNNSTDEKTIFFIPMKIDFSQLPVYMTRDNPGTPTVAVIVKFLPPDTARVVPSLQMSPSAERILSQPKVPTWGGDYGTCLMDYIPAVGKHLEEMVGNLQRGYEKRQEFIAALLSHFGRAVLEYDIECYLNIHLLFDYKGFFVIVILMLSEQFPQKQPQMKLCSAYHRLRGEPCQSIIDTYPYSPRWTANAMVEKIREFLLETIPKFKQLSVREGQWIH